MNFFEWLPLMPHMMWMATRDQDTIIFELEGLAIAVGLRLFEKHIRGRRLTVCTVQAFLIKCKSTNASMDSIIPLICTSKDSRPDVMD